MGTRGVVWALAAAGAMALVVGAHLGATSYSRRPPSASTKSRAPDAPVTTHAPGGGPDGGAVASLAILLTTPPTLFASFDNGGVFRTSDRGRTWTPADRGLPQEIGCELVAEPASTSVVYANCFRDLFKSVNGGVSWRLLDVDDAQAPLIAPSDPRVLYVPFLSVRSTDGGRRWRDVSPALLEGAVAIDPSDASTLYAVDKGLLRSRNAGVSWRRVNPGPRTEFSIGLLAIDPDDNRTMYAATANGELFKTTTRGALWFEAGAGLGDDWLRSIDFAGPSSQVMFGRTREQITRSLDAGEHWEPVPSPPGNPDISAFAVDPTSATTLYVGTRSGVFMTTDLGARWTLLDRGIDRAQATVALHQAKGSTTLFATLEGRVFTSRADGASWQPADDAGAFPAGGSSFIESDHAGGLVARTASGLVTRPRDSSRWTRFTPEPPPDTLSLVVSRSDPSIAYATTRSGLKRTVHGGPWQAVSAGGEDLATISIASGTSRIGYAGNHPLVRRGQMWRTLDGGETWDNLGECDTYILSSCKPIVDPNDSDTVYVWVFGSVVGGGAFIRKSLDGGASWSDLPPVDFFTVVPTVPTTLFMQTSAGRPLSKSVDRGEHWSPIGAGLPSGATLIDIVGDPRVPGRFFAATRGYGVFRSDDGGATWHPTGPTAATP